MIVYLNGTFLPESEAKVPVLDRGFIFGDGVYEVIPAYDRVPFRLPQHLVRLQASLDAIRLANPLSEAEWTAHIGTLIARNEGTDQSIYLQVTRGVARRDHGFPKDVKPTVFMMSTPFKGPPAEHVAQGIAAVTHTDFRWLKCNVKSVSLLANVLLRQYATDAGAAECVLLRDGYLTEGSSSNIFVVKNGTLTAPPKDHLILAGITYDVVVEIARDAGIPVAIREIPEVELRAADEVILSASGRELLAITTLDGRQVGDGRPGPVARRLIDLFARVKRGQAA